MTNTVLLNNVDHHDLRVITRHAPELGDSVNQLLVFPTEFESIQREYPIFLRRKQDGEYQPVALLGLDRDENLFLDETGWQARYIPAIRQRGPFSIEVQEQLVDGEPHAEPMIRVDLDDPRVSRSEGVPLFLPHGGNAPYLGHIAGVLRTIFVGNKLIAPMFAAFHEFGLIREAEVEIRLDDATLYRLPGYHTIAEDRLAALDGAALEALHRTGFLRAAFLAAASLANVNRLIELKNRRRAG
ncbi:MAG: SapC family protein [Pseudomonadota bacterium]